MADTAAPAIAMADTSVPRESVQMDGAEVPMKNGDGVKGGMDSMPASYPIDGLEALRDDPCLKCAVSDHSDIDSERPAERGRQALGVQGSRAAPR